MRAASVVSAGLPKIVSSHTTVVSAASTGRSANRRARTMPMAANAFSRVMRRFMDSLRSIDDP